MKAKGDFSKILHLFHYTENGFTFLEIMVVLTILGSLAGLATLGVVRFIGGATEEIQAVEELQVQMGASTYIADGNTISEPFTVTPSDQGVLDPYLIGNLKNSWIVDVDGNITYAGGSGETGGKMKWPGN
jgi:prepilin-type N-terminal cleavage/methylation domain-containing protein